MTYPFQPDTAAAFTSGKLTRRDLLQRTAVVGVGATGLGALLSACGSSASNAPASSSATFDKQAVMQFAMNTTIPGLDAQKWWNGAAACGQHAMFESMLTIDPYQNGALVPLVATGFPKIENNGLRYTFTLRPGVKFSNGMPLTSADYKYSFERLVIPSFGSEIGPLFTSLPIVGMSAVLNQKAKTLSGVTTPDPHTIVFDFEYPDSAFVYVVSHYMAGAVPMAMVEEIGFNKFNWAPVGTGPFTVDVVNQESAITLNRNKNYWNPAVPRYAGVNWQMGIDDTLGMLRIEGGQDDLIYDPVPSGFVANVLNNPTYVKNGQTQYYDAEQLLLDVAQCQRSGAEEPDSQKGDRDGGQQGADPAGDARAWHGRQRHFLLAAEPVLPRRLSCTPMIRRRPRSCSASVGLPSGTTVKMWSSNRFPYEAVGQVIQADLAAIGLNVDYIPMEYDAFVTLAGNLPAGIVAVGL